MKLFMFWHRKHGLQAKRVGPRSFHEVGGRNKDMICAYLTPAQDGKQNPKSLPKLESLRSSARDEEISLRLQQGASILEIASAFERIPEFIARQHKRLFSRIGSGGNLVAFQWPARRGPWSGEEIRSLIVLTDKGHAFSVISFWLRRAPGSVRKKLTEMVVGNTQNGPQELPPGLRERLFSERLNNILRDLCQHPMTSKWKDHIFSKTLEEWAFILSSGIPDRVKSALGGLTAPTYDELMDMPAVCTQDARVYARLMCGSLNQYSSDRFVYVGSESKSGHELKARMFQHIYRKNHAKEKGTRLQNLIRVEKPTYLGIS